MTGDRNEQSSTGRELSRRRFLGLSLGVPSALALVVLGARSLTSRSGLASAQALEPTPACGDDTNLTIPEEEGPFFKPSSPERTSVLDAGMARDRIFNPTLLMDVQDAADGQQATFTFVVNT